MKKNLFLIFFLSTCFIHSQTYTWLRGSVLSGTNIGVYGTLGVSSTANDPGYREGAAHWTDAAGNLWLFGGKGYDASGSFGWLNDLWKYTVSNNQWTWIGGSNIINQSGVYNYTINPNSIPGAREFAVSWTDNSGNFWLFGGDGFASSSTFGKLGDLWKYNLTSGIWTFMKGYNIINQQGIYGNIGSSFSSSNPGCRRGSVSWTDASGRLLLFGGRGYDATTGNGYLNDVWRFDITTMQWIWLEGSNAINQLSIYGTLAVAANTNTPGGRELSACWATSSGLVYMFGGSGYGASAFGNLNDVWMYDPSIGNWIWQNGSTGINQTGVYGTLGIEAGTTHPGARFSCGSWKDDTGNLWLYGGDGISSTGPDLLNDMFKYNPCTNKWTWMKGSGSGFQNGTYGTAGTAAAANTPGSRSYNTFWRGLNNTFWLLGGRGYGASGGSINNMNDLWKFIPPCFNSNAVSSSGTALCSGYPATLSLPANCEGTVQWFTSPTGGTPVGNGNFTITPTAVSSQSIYTYYAEAASCTLSPRGLITLTVNALPSFTVSPASLCQNTQATLSASGGTFFSWNGTTTGSTLNIPSPSGSTYTYQLAGTDARGCSNFMQGSIPVNPKPGVIISSSKPGGVCLNNSATLTATGAASYTWGAGQNNNFITVTPLINTTYSLSGTDINGCKNSFTLQQAVLALPIITVTAAQLCDNVATGLVGVGASSYTWNQGSFQGPVLTFTPTLPKVSFTLQGTDINGCSSSITASLAVHEQPTITISSSQLEICAGYSAILTASGASSYFWPGNGHSGITLTVSPGVSTTYSVTGNNVFGCSSTSTILQKVAECTGVQKYNNNETFNLYPNPSNGVFIIEIEAGKPLTKLIIYTTLGQKIHQELLYTGKNFIQSHLAKGLYYYQLIRENENLTQGRILVE